MIPVVFGLLYKYDVLPIFVMNGEMMSRWEMKVDVIHDAVSFCGIAGLQSGVEDPTNLPA